MRNLLSPPAPCHLHKPFDLISNLLSQALRGVESANFEFPLFTKDQQRVEILLNATARYCPVPVAGIAVNKVKEKWGREGDYPRPQRGSVGVADFPCFARDERPCPRNM